MVKHMLKIMVFTLLIILPIATLAESQGIFDFIIVFYKNNSAEIKNFNVIEGVSLIPSQSGDYKIKLISLNNDILFENQLTVQFETHQDVIIDGKRQAKDIMLDKIEVHVRIPFYSNADRLEIYFKDNKILTYKIELCNNNGICELIRAENSFSCPNDCNSGGMDNYCDGILDGKCDPDCLVKDLDIDCTCGNKVCDVRENEKTCKIDCRVGWWERFIKWFKAIWR